MARKASTLLRQLPGASQALRELEDAVAVAPVEVGLLGQGRRGQHQVREGGGLGVRELVDHDEAPRIRQGPPHARAVRADGRRVVAVNEDGPEPAALELQPEGRVGQHPPLGPRGALVRPRHARVVEAEVIAALEVQAVRVPEHRGQGADRAHGRAAVAPARKADAGLDQRALGREQGLLQGLHGRGLEPRDLLQPLRGPGPHGRLAELAPAPGLLLDPGLVHAPRCEGPAHERQGQGRIGPRAQDHGDRAMSTQRLERVTPPDINHEHGGSRAQCPQHARVEGLHGAAQLGAPHDDHITALDLDLEVGAHRGAQHRRVRGLGRRVADGPVRLPGAQGVEEARGEVARDLPHVARVGEAEDSVAVEPSHARADDLERLLPGGGAQPIPLTQLRLEQPLGSVDDLVVGRRLAAQGPLAPGVRRVAAQPDEASLGVRLEQRPARVRAVERAGAGVQGHGGILARPGNGTGAGRALRDRPRRSTARRRQASTFPAPSSVSSMGL